ncbi:acylphosphatase [Archaeoglobales archaeon]|nr:MAG: acylphosphatase [Archaeoglobales archaeon]
MRVKITITGKVHDVGYRLHLLNQADSLLINHFDARNVLINGKQALIVLIEGDEEQVKEFINFVKSTKPEKAIVEDIEVGEFKGTIRTIDSYRNSLMLEQLNKIVQVGLNMLEKQDSMLEKQDSMLEKQDKTIEKIDETKSYLGQKIDKVSEKVDTVSEKIDLLRLDLKTYMDQRFNKMEKEIERIKAKIGLD